MKNISWITLGFVALVTACGGDDDSGSGSASTGGASSSGGSAGTSTGGATTGGSAGSAGSAGAASGGSGGSPSDAGPTDGGATDGSATDGSVTDGAAGGDAGPPPPIGCPPTFSKEVFRDDFEGSSVDGAKWVVANQNTGGGVFTQLTKMLAANVSVSGGRLHVASKRHCQDPYPNPTPEHPALCSGTSYYSGGWIRAKQGYAAGKGLMIFHAKMPKPVQGTFPALWARNSDSGANYGELDLIETWWDTKTKGVAGDPDVFFITTWLGSGPFNTTGNQVGPFPSLPSVFHVWEVEWDANASPAHVKYYYRDQPGATRQLLRTVTVATQGLSGKITEAQYKSVLALPWRPYVDFAVEPGTTAWHVGPNLAATYDPEDLEVESVVVCQP